MNHTELIWPYGKAHRGKPLSEIPTRYLEWALKTMDCLSSNEIVEIEQFLSGETFQDWPEGYAQLTADERLTVWIDRWGANE